MDVVELLIDYQNFSQGIDGKDTEYRSLKMIKIFYVLFFSPIQDLEKLKSNLRLPRFFKVDVSVTAILNVHHVRNSKTFYLDIQCTAVYIFDVL